MHGMSTAKYVVPHYHPESQEIDSGRGLFGGGQLDRRLTRLSGIVLTRETQIGHDLFPQLLSVDNPYFVWDKAVAVSSSHGFETTSIPLLERELGISK